MRLRSLVTAVSVALGVLPVAAAVGPVPTASAAATPAAFVPLPVPQRLLDNRATGAVAGGTSVSVNVTGAAPLPANGAATAVVLNVTVLGPAGAGFWTVWPHDAAMPNASNLNVDEQASLQGGALAVANLVTVPVGSSGLVDVFSETGGYLLVDMLGYYTPAATAAAGRFQALAAPVRAVDTRLANRIVDPGSTTEYRVPNAAGAAAVALNVTTIALGSGYWTVFPAGVGAPDASNLNSTGLGHVVANQVVVPVDADGDFQVFSSGGGHLIVDVVGTFTGAGAPVAADGLFVALDRPTRFLDTRVAALNPLGNGQKALPGWNVEVPVTGNPAIGRSDVAAVVLNLTTLDGPAGGYTSVTPAGSSDPAVKARTTSTLNTIRAAQVLANHATVPVTARGFDVFSERGGHLIADVAGFYVGTPAPAPFGPPQNADPTPAGCLGFSSAAVGPITRGSGRPAVSILQQRLLDLGFWLSATDGNYGVTTTQAVMAFQFWSGLPTTGVTDDATAAAINSTLCRPTAGVAGTDLLEVDKSQQLAYVIKGGRVVWVLHVSTGNGRNYDEENRKGGGREIGVAVTPVGDFRVYRVSDEARYEGTLGTMYRPRFFSGGVAVHGASSVPNYPASHGCVRVTNPAMDMLWATDALPMRGRVVVHE